MKHSNLQKPRFLTIFVLTLLAFLPACTKTKTPVEEGNEKQIFHFAAGSEPATLDPHLSTGVPEWYRLLTLFEGLVVLNPKTLDAEPGVAQSWKISADGKTYTFELRPNAKWSNGDPMTAQDFVNSWQRILTPSLASEYAYMLFYLKNAKEYNEGKVTDFAKVGVKAPEPLKLVVELNEPTPYFLKMLFHHSAFPVHKPSIEKVGSFFDRGTQWMRPGAVTNGPFHLTAWEVNKVNRVTRNPHYWDAGRIKLNEINFYPVESQQVEERMFRAGQVHQTYEMPLSKVMSYRKEEPHLTRIFPYFGTYYFRLNVTRKPLNDPRVRRALSMAIDRQAIVDDILKGGEIPAFSYTPPGAEGFVAKARTQYDPEQARKLLAEAGFPGGKGFPKMEIHFNTSDRHKTMAEAVQQMWKTQLGIDLTLANQDWKVYLDAQSRLNYDISRAAWVGDYVDPNAFLEMYETGGTQNKTGWGNAKYDEALKLSRKTTGAKRIEMFDKMEEILVNEVPIIPVYFYVKAFLQRPEVKGWHGNLLDYNNYKDVYLESKPH